jgi:TrmH family RNA methyltransferase
MSLAVAVVDAETPGNVGTIARAMKNFGFDDLLLVDPPPLDPEGEAYGFAGRAREDVLPEARELTFDELVDGYHSIACTAVPNEDGRSHVRYPILTPVELPDRLDELDGDIAVVFGRERVGLTNEELARLDEICSIPADSDYPSLNLGQAATIVLYELRSIGLDSTQHPAERHELADADEVERVHDRFGEFLDAIGHPKPKRAKAARMFRRLLGRADPTPREARTLTGIFRRGARRAADDPDEGF